MLVFLINKRKFSRFVFINFPSYDCIASSSLNYISIELNKISINISSRVLVWISIKCTARHEEQPKYLVTDKKTSAIL